MAWMAYGLINNSFTQFYPWTDYFGQYVTMTFYYHDVWHTFFKTGYFELYSPNTYLGSDNIGSNSYYGLFDPFLFICYLFPRSWIPQTFALATMVKGAVGAMAMRAYLKYRGQTPLAKSVESIVELPETIDVTLVEEDGTTRLARWNTVTGEMVKVNGWYDLKGRKLNSKPQNKGMFIGNTNIQK